MRVSCVQPPLRRVLEACARVRSVTGMWVVLNAQAGAGEHAGVLEVCAWSSARKMGVWATFPARVEQAGQVVVPAALLAKSLAAIRAERITLARVEVAGPVVVQADALIKALKAGPALQLEGTWMSVRGTASTQKIRVRLPSHEATETLPNLAAWRPAGHLLGEVEPGRLRAALAPCLYLAHQRAAPVGASGMDHALVLLQTGLPLQWTATTPSAVASQLLPVQAPTPLKTHALFDEEVLTWLERALVGQTRVVRLLLVPQEGANCILLIECEDMTLFLPGLTEPLPLVWERRIQDPSLRTLTVPCAALLRALTFFSTSWEGDQSRVVRLWVSQNHLCLNWSAGTADVPSVVAEQSMALCAPAADTAPVLVRVSMLLRFLRLLKIHREISLELGQFEGKRGQGTPFDWVRLAGQRDASSQLMMTTSTLSSSSPSVEEQVERKTERVSDLAQI